MSLQIGLALGGGAARGLAHLGVIQALQEADIPIDIICGASIGSIVGSIYASNPDIKECIHQVTSYLTSEDFDRARLSFIQSSDREKDGYIHKVKQLLMKGYLLAVSFSQSSFIEEDIYLGNINRLIPNQLIEDTQIKLGLVAANLSTGEEVLFTEGAIIERIMASCAIPGVFPPVMIDRVTYVDGSWVSPVPVESTKKMGADFVIAVDINPEMSDDTLIENGLSILVRSSECSRQALRNVTIGSADAIIPIHLMDVHWADFLRFEQTMDRGYYAAKEMIPSIKKELSKKRWKRLFSFS